MGTVAKILWAGFIMVLSFLGQTAHAAATLGLEGSQFEAQCKTEIQGALNEDQKKWKGAEEILLLGSFTDQKALASVKETDSKFADAAARIAAQANAQACRSNDKSAGEYVESIACSGDVKATEAAETAQLTGAGSDPLKIAETTKIIQQQHIAQTYALYRANELEYLKQKANCHLARCEAEKLKASSNEKTQKDAESVIRESRRISKSLDDDKGPVVCGHKNLESIAATQYSGAGIDKVMRELRYNDRGAIGRGVKWIGDKTGLGETGAWIGVGAIATGGVLLATGVLGGGKKHKNQPQAAKGQNQNTQLPDQQNQNLFQTCFNGAVSDPSCMNLAAAVCQKGNMTGAANPNFCERYAKLQNPQTPLSPSAPTQRQVAPVVISGASSGPSRAPAASVFAANSVSTDSSGSLLGLNSASVQSVRKLGLLAGGL